MGMDEGSSRIVACSIFPAFRAGCGEAHSLDFDGIVAGQHGETKGKMAKKQGKFRKPCAGDHKEKLRIKLRCVHQDTSHASACRNCINFEFDGK
jgi:hypothetical protein